jgi:hypothetical protein
LDGGRSVVVTPRALAAIGVVGLVARHVLVTARPFASAYGILRWRWFAWIHVPLILWAFSIPFVAYPCPFTDWEKALRADAGLPVYQGHFLQHYVYEPLAPHGELFFIAAAALVVGPAYILIFRQWKSERARRPTSGRRNRMRMHT